MMIITPIDTQSSVLVGYLTINFDPALTSLSLRGLNLQTTLILQTASLMSADIGKLKCIDVNYDVDVKLSKLLSIHRNKKKHKKVNELAQPKD